MEEKKAFLFQFRQERKHNKTYITFFGKLLFFRNKRLEKLGLSPFKKIFYETEIFALLKKNTTTTQTVIYPNVVFCGKIIINSVTHSIANCIKRMVVYSP